MGKMAKIKICGLTRPEDVQAVNEAKPDFAGFIIEYPKSRRNVTEEQLRKLAGKLDKKIFPVGVFVNAPVQLPIKLLKEGVIAMAQLHGQEDEDYIERVQNVTGRPVIKAFSVKTAQDVEKALRSPADYILLDQGGGGTGQTFDWDLVPRIRRPYFLAGGLGTDNLKAAITRLSPWAVDLSSSLETDGHKDPEKIREAVALVRQIGI